MQSRLTKAITQLQEEKELNSALRQNQKQWSEKVVSLEKELHATMEVKNKVRNVLKRFYPSNAEATFVQSARSQRFLKTI